MNDVTPEATMARLEMQNRIVNCNVPMRKLVRRRDGMPIKTKLAERFPLLTRRQRRELARKARKEAVKA